eukprot:1137998-Pelagomonas_calceolata.AAC.9
MSKIDCCLQHQSDYAVRDSSPAHLIVHFYSRIEAQKPGDHELSAIADCIHRTVLDHNALEILQQDLQGRPRGKACFRAGNDILGMHHHTQNQEPSICHPHVWTWVPRPAAEAQLSNFE